MRKAIEPGVTLLGRTNFRNKHKVFGIRKTDRRQHLYLVGRTGVGKTTLIESLVRQDLVNGEGLLLLDPHGDLAKRVRAFASTTGRKIIFWNPAHPNSTIGLNPLEQAPPEARSLAASGLLDTFKKFWSDSWGPRTEHLLRNALFALIERADSKLSDVTRLMTDSAYRKEIAREISNVEVRRFWQSEFEKYPFRFRAEAIAPIQNKIGAFLSDPILQRILSAEKSSFDLRTLMDERGVLVVNLAKGKLGEDTTALLGGLLVSRLASAAMSRTDQAVEERHDFYVYLDEFQTFTTRTVASMLSELRKYGCALVLSHQHLSQLDPLIRDAVLANVGTMICFRVGASDAGLLAREFAPEFDATDLTNLPNYSVYLKLLIDGVVSRPFSAETIQLDEEPAAA